LITEEQYKKLYNKERQAIDKKLAGLLTNRKPASLYEPSAYLLDNPGKRIRPFLVLLSAKAAGTSFSKVYNAALAIEMLHTFTLAHDDIMDNADMRRGHLTLHKKYDLSTAILAGDSLLSIAYEYLLKDLNGDAKSVIATFTRSLVEVCEGQSLDKEFEVLPTVSLPLYIEMITKKTAIMLETCCAVGAQIAGASPEVVKALSKFGKNIGIAFQIQDDLLDIIGDEKSFGKNIGGDLIEGKKTYLFIEALERADKKSKPHFMRMIKNKGISPEEIPFFKNLYFELGVIDDAHKAITSYSNKALKSLAAIQDEDNRELLKRLAYHLIKRTN
jgi:geranylgeranyl diphosphate synthase, type II